MMKIPKNKRNQTIRHHANIFRNVRINVYAHDGKKCKIMLCEKNKFDTYIQFKKMKRNSNNNFLC